MHSRHSSQHRFPASARVGACAHSRPRRFAPRSASRRSRRSQLASRICSRSRWRSSGIIIMCGGASPRSGPRCGIQRRADSSASPGGDRSLIARRSFCSRPRQKSAFCCGVSERHSCARCSGVKCCQIPPRPASAGGWFGGACANAPKARTSSSGKKLHWLQAAPDRRRFDDFSMIDIITPVGGKFCNSLRTLRAGGAGIRSIAIHETSKLREKGQR